MTLRKLNLFKRVIQQEKLHKNNNITKEYLVIQFEKLNQENGWKKELPLVAE